MNSRISSSMETPSTPPEVVSALAVVGVIWYLSISIFSHFERYSFRVDPIHEREISGPVRFQFGFIEVNLVLDPGRTADEVVKTTVHLVFQKLG